MARGQVELGVEQHRFGDRTQPARISSPSSSFRRRYSLKAASGCICIGGGWSRSKLGFGTLPLITNLPLVAAAVEAVSANARSNSELDRWSRP